MRLSCLFAALACALNAGPARAQLAVATYELNNNYNAEQSGPPALNPYSSGTGTLSFVTDTVNIGSQNVSRTVLVHGGSASANPANQAGVELSTTTLLTNPNIYSAEFVFS